MAIWDLISAEVNRGDPYTWALLPIFGYAPAIIMPAIRTEASDRRCSEWHLRHLRADDPGRFSTSPQIQRTSRLSRLLAMPLIPMVLTKLSTELVKIAMHVGFLDHLDERTSRPGSRNAAEVAALP